MKLLEGKVAVVTGAARGIGKAIALEFAKEGADVAFTDLAIDENGKATEAEIAALGVKAKGYASNAANFEETHEVIDRIVKDFGRIDILVNNAGITKDGLMMRMSEAQWDAVLTVNLKSAFNFIHAVTPIMARQKSGSIINMSSVVGVSGNAGQCNYSASKAGMIGLAKSIAKEMGPRGIRANAIAPGFIMTEMTDKLPDEVAGWLARMREAGIGLTIVSNGAEKRVRPFAQKLGLAYLYRSAKPLPFALMAARRRMGVKRREMAMVGDQLYADRMAAALYGIPGLMVIPRGPDLGAQVVLKRKWEKRHWQEYYDRGGKTL